MLRWPIFSVDSFHMLFLCHWILLRSDGSVKLHKLLDWYFSGLDKFNLLRCMLSGFILRYRGLIGSNSVVYRGRLFSSGRE